MVITPRGEEHFLGSLVQHVISEGEPLAKTLPIPEALKTVVSEANLFMRATEWLLAAREEECNEINTRYQALTEQVACQFQSFRD
jgi:hypothetical protein